MNNLVMSITKSKSVSFDISENKTKIVERYNHKTADYLPKSVLTKNDIKSALNIIKIAILRKTFNGKELKPVVDFHNKLNDFVNAN